MHWPPPLVDAGNTFEPPRLSQVNLRPINLYDTDRRFADALGLQVVCPLDASAQPAGPEPERVADPPGRPPEALDHAAGRQVEPLGGHRNPTALQAHAVGGRELDPAARRPQRQV